MACVLALGLAVAAPASAQPGVFAHGTVEQLFTTAQPGAPAGFTFTGSYHAAGDASADPPYMRKMVFYPPLGTRYDTRVPARCTASDTELQLRGPAACPAGSQIGKGTSSGKVLGTFQGTLDTYLFNNAGEQILVGATPGLWTVGRGRIGPDGSITYAFPTCFPNFDPPGCPVDDVLQLASTMNAPAVTRTSDGTTRGYVTTPPTCPASGQWDTTIKFWWADGSQDTAVTQTPCRLADASP